MTPSVGRIVHYVSRGSADGVFTPECRAAIIAEVSPDTGRVAIMVFNPQGIFWDWDMHYDEGHRPGSWHWPERVE